MSFRSDIKYFFTLVFELGLSMNEGRQKWVRNAKTMRDYEIQSVSIRGDSRNDRLGNGGHIDHIHRDTADPKEVIYLKAES